MKGNAEEVCLPPRKMFRIEVYLRIIDKSMNQSIKIYIAPLKDLYPEALPTQVKRKRTVFKSWLTENRQHLGGASDLRNALPGCWTNH